MKKRLSLLCLLLCLPLCAGCAGGGTASASASPSPETPSPTPSSSPSPAAVSPTPSAVPSPTVFTPTPSSSAAPSPTVFTPTSSPSASPSPKTPAPTAAPTLPSDPKAGRALVWSDEFDGTALDTDKWDTGFTMTTGGAQKTDSKHIAVKDGALVLTSTYSPFGGCQTPAGLLTQGKMSFTYGYVEMRAILPFRHGAWPSFWMKSELKNAKWMAEYDIFEVFSNDRYLEFNLHKWSNSTGGDHVQFNPTPRGYTFPATAKPWEEYHLYAMEWTPDTITFYVDGVARCKADVSASSVYGDWGVTGLKGMDAFRDSAYLILNNSVITDQNYSSWMGDWKATKDDYPFTYQVDYIRLYQKSGETLNVK